MAPVTVMSCERSTMHATLTVADKLHRVLLVIRPFVKVASRMLGILTSCTLPPDQSAL